MKASELRSKNADELAALLLEMRRKQFNLRMEAGTGQPARASDVRETRKTIARIKTLMNERRGGENA
ncbi:MAG: 50S ribosomal protein L29 [Gammaproteobacteria bacterium]